VINLFRLILLKIKDSNGNFARQNNHKMKISLFYKPFMLKVCLSLFIFMYVIVRPDHANAGFFSNLITKIVGQETQASEIVENEENIHNSQNVPLLESSINPDLKNIKDEPVAISLTNEALLSNNGALGVDSELDKYDSATKITTYIVKKGDTLEGIAKKLKIPKSTIIASNADLKKSDLLKVGQSLTIFTIKSNLATKETTKEVEKVSISKKDIPINEKEETKETNEAKVIPDPQIEQPIKNPLPEQQEISTQPLPEPQVSNGQPEGDIDNGYIWPFPKGIGRVSQGLHADQAYDFAAPKGTPIYAIQNGKVLIADNSGYNGGYGLYVVIDFDDGRQAIFGHMSKVATTAGKIVKKGEIIGYVGSTGKSTGPHVHVGFHGTLRNPYIGLKVNSTDFVDNE
jgi:murein DD-endopeptidase MepM/ murein hydrolase activator NlpD